MRRFLLLLRNEFRLAVTALPIQVIAIIQPTILFLLMSVILVKPTFDMNIMASNSHQTHSLIQAMEMVGSPVGQPYINPIQVNTINKDSMQQIISVNKQGDSFLALQKYGFIDSNLVKNLRNRLTAASLILWNEDLGNQAITIQEHPALPIDVPFKVYFGMALLPTAVFIAAVFTGSVLTGQDFEFDTIAEYRLTPYPYSLCLAARLTRLLITGLLGGLVLVFFIGVTTYYWPTNILILLTYLIPIALCAAGIGVSAGLIFKRTIPSFVISLALSFTFWIMGSAFGLAKGFGGLYSFLSSLTLNTHTVYLLFKQYFGFNAIQPLPSVIFLITFTVLITSITIYLYRKQLSRLD